MEDTVFSQQEHLQCAVILSVDSPSANPTVFHPALCGWDHYFGLSLRPTDFFAILKVISFPGKLSAHGASVPA